MTGPRFSFAVHVLREDGSAAGQVPIDVDWEPARECLRFLALRRGRPPAEAFALDCALDPVWHPKRGAPFLAGFRARAAEEGDSAASGSAGTGELRHDFRTDYFARASRTAAARLVAEGALREGEPFHSLPVAFPRGEEPAAAVPAPRLLTRPAVPDVPIRAGSLGARLGRSAAHGIAARIEDVPVFVPRDVLDGAAVLAHAAERKETGGILVGHLHRDADTAGVFVEVTAQIPARHAEADLVRLSFTPEVWTDVSAALALRGRGEIMLGWWHSHPVREWCKDCSEESRRQCSLAADFFSDHDRVLQRTVFPRAYSLGLVVNDVAAEAPTFSLFGWDGGVLRPRGFRVLEPDRPGPGGPGKTEEAAATAGAAGKATTGGGNHGG